MFKMSPEMLDQHHQQILHSIIADKAQSLISIAATAGTLFITLREHALLSITNAPQFIAKLLRLNPTLNILAVSIAQITPCVVPDAKSIVILTDDGQYSLLAEYSSTAHTVTEANYPILACSENIDEEEQTQGPLYAANLLHTNTEAQPGSLNVVYLDFLAATAELSMLGSLPAQAPILGASMTYLPNQHDMLDLPMILH